VDAIAGQCRGQAFQSGKSFQHGDVKTDAGVCGQSRGQVR
jgi:hypothetical protein